MKTIDVQVQQIATNAEHADTACGELITHVRERNAELSSAYVQWQKEKDDHRMLVNSVIDALTRPSRPWLIQRESRRARDRGKDLWTPASSRRFSDAEK